MLLLKQKKWKRRHPCWLYGKEKDLKGEPQTTKSQQIRNGHEMDTVLKDTNHWNWSKETGSLHSRRHCRRAGGTQPPRAPEPHVAAGEAAAALQATTPHGVKDQDRNWRLTRQRHIYLQATAESKGSHQNRTSQKIMGKYHKISERTIKMGAFDICKLHINKVI